MNHDDNFKSCLKKEVSRVFGVPVQFLKNLDFNSLYNDRNIYTWYEGQKDKRDKA